LNHWIDCLGLYLLGPGPVSSLCKLTVSGTKKGKKRSLEVGLILQMVWDFEP